MPACHPPPHRVLIVDIDARVRAALTALVDATPGLQMVAVCDTTWRAEEARRLARPTVAVVGLSCGPDGVETVRTLAPHLPVVAVSTRASDAEPALTAGATTFCDQDGDADALSAAVVAAAQAGRYRAGRRYPSQNAAFIEEQS